LAKWNIHKIPETSVNFGIKQLICFLKLPIDPSWCLFVLNNHFVIPFNVFPTHYPRFCIGFASVLPATGFS